ncbi:MAG: mechanosensitive ion channel protein MscS [Elusimicrobia bacterium HGW-Elusimicrobia-3]|nr:MAG: mechanosensitive ion channel protein MscS [Elusimicrobia bacterium HGW-Elusimicrobia-3]
MEKWMTDSALILALALAASGLAYWGLILLSKYVLPKRILSPRLVNHIMRSLRLPLGLLVVSFSIGGAVTLMELPEVLGRAAPRTLTVLQIILMAWLAVRVTGIGRELVMNAFDITAKDNLQARKIHTQIRVVEQILAALISFFAITAVLMTFDKVRQLGVSLLASAGVMGIILGFAAQKSIATLFAGIQIALTQPIRVDDVVIVEREWGWIEEITLTYVVVRIWDLRRLILPITYFLDKPFENWTRVSADILGTVSVFTDYTAPVGEFRAEVRRICEGSELWDGKVCGVQVVNASDTTIEVRALVSASDSSRCWDLRCLVREKMIDFLREKHPACMPRTRVLLDPRTAAGRPEASPA